MFYSFNVPFKLATFICGNRDKHLHYTCDEELLDVHESWVVELFGKDKVSAQAMPEWRTILCIRKASKLNY